MHRAMAESILDQYRSVLSNKKRVNELVQGLGHLETLTLLEKTGALTKLEADELKFLSIRDGTTGFRQALELIRDKNSLERYIGLSRVVYYHNEFIGRQVFPFVSSLSESEHPKLVVRSPFSHPIQSAPQRQIEPAAHQPDVLWMCASEQLYKLAIQEGGVSVHQEVHQTPSKKFKYQKLEPTNEMRVLAHPHGDHLRYPVVWVMCPTQSTTLSKPVIRGLLRYYNKIQYFILNDENGSRDVHVTTPASVCVPKTTDNGCGFIGELRHITALWMLRKDEGKCDWMCDKAHEQPLVQFCSLSVVKSDQVKSLYTGADELWREGITTPYVGVVSEEEDEGACPTCGGESGLHSVQYSLTIVHYLCTNMLWTKRNST